VAAHRYWRAINVEPYGDLGLEISEFQLLVAGARVDASATLTSSVAPSSGALADLKDNDTATAAAWSAIAVRGLVLNWDFGGGGDQDVSDIRIGSTTSSAKFLRAVQLQYSDDAATWFTLQRQTEMGLLSIIGSIAWPGPRTKTASVTWNNRWSKIQTGTGIVLDSTEQVASTTQSHQVQGVVGQSSGVRQFEIVTSAVTNVLYVIAGLAQAMPFTGPWNYNSGTSWTVLMSNGQKYTNGTTNAAFTTAIAAGATIGFVVNFAAGSITVYVNGVSRGVMFTGLTLGTVYPMSAYMVSGGAPGMAGMTLKTGSLTYPIGGATAWDEPELVAVNRGYGRTLLASIQIPTTAGYAWPAGGRVLMSQPLKARKNFLIDQNVQGIGRVKGTTKDKNTPSNIPVSERVVLLRQRDCMPIRQVWSTPGTGAFSFDYVDETETYTVLSFDHDLNYRAVAASDLTVANGGVELIA
jgi:hypothetical protein